MSKVKKIVQWVTEHSRLRDLQSFNLQKDAAYFERATDIFDRIKAAVDDSEVEMCDDGMGKIFALCTDGLYPEDVEHDTLPVFLDTLAEIMADWKVTGCNPQREANRKDQEESDEDEDDE